MDAQFPPHLPADAMHDLEPHQLAAMRKAEKKPAQVAQKTIKAAAAAAAAPPKKTTTSPSATPPASPASPAAAKAAAKAAQTLATPPSTPLSQSPIATPPGGLSPAVKPKPKPLTEADASRMLKEAVINKTGLLPLELQKQGPSLTGTLVLPPEVKPTLATLQFITKTFPNLSEIDLTGHIELTADNKLDPAKKEQIDLLYFLTNQSKLRTITLNSRVSIQREIGVDLVESLAELTGTKAVIEQIYKKAEEKLINVFPPGEARFGANVKEYADADSEKILFLTSRLLTNLQSLALTSSTLPEGFLKTLRDSTLLPHTLQTLDLTQAQMHIDELQPLLSFKKLKKLIVSPTLTIEGHSQIRIYLESEFIRRNQSSAHSRLPATNALPKNFGKPPTGKPEPEEPVQPQLKAAARPVVGPSQTELNERPLVAALRTTLKDKKVLTEAELALFDTFMLHFYKHNRLSDEAGQIERFELSPQYALIMIGAKTVDEEKKFFKNLSKVIHPDKNVGAEKATLAFYTLLSKYLTHYHQLVHGSAKPESP